MARQGLSEDRPNHVFSVFSSALASLMSELVDSVHNRMKEGHTELLVVVVLQKQKMPLEIIKHTRARHA